MSFYRTATLAPASTLLWIGLFCLASRRVSAQPPIDPLESRVQQLIQQLDADQFRRRQHAQRELVAVGFSAVPALRIAATHPSKEVRYRARWLVDAIQYGDLDRRFASFGRKPAEKIDVEIGMWLIARLFEPQLKRASVTRQLDDLARRVRKRLSGPASDADPKAVIAAMHQVLFVECGFRGNTENYDDPRNSSISYVLREKKGLPILLSHVVVSVAARIDAPIIGLSVPGRYMVKYDGSRAPHGFPNDDVVINPFEKGRIMTAGELQREWPGLPPAARSNSTNHREIMSRMLRNLLSDCQQASDKTRTRRVARYLHWMENGGR